MHVLIRTPAECQEIGFLGVGIEEKLLQSGGGTKDSEAIVFV